MKLKRMEKQSYKTHSPSLACAYFGSKQSYLRSEFVYNLCKPKIPKVDRICNKYKILKRIEIQKNVRSKNRSNLLQCLIKLSMLFLWD